MAVEAGPQETVNDIWVLGHGPHGPEANTALILSSCGSKITY